MHSHKTSSPHVVDTYMPLRHMEQTSTLRARSLYAELWAALVATARFRRCLMEAFNS